MSNISTAAKLAQEVSKGFGELNLKYWSNAFNLLSGAERIDESFIQSLKENFRRQVCFVVSDSNKDVDGNRIFGSALEYLMHDAMHIVELESDCTRRNSRNIPRPPGRTYADLIQKIQKLASEVGLK